MDTHIRTTCPKKKVSERATMLKKNLPHSTQKELGPVDKRQTRQSLVQQKM